MVKKKKKPKKVCSECGKPCLTLSRKGYCVECSEKLSVESIRSLREKEGATYEKWRTKTLAGLKRESGKKEVKNRG